MSENSTVHAVQSEPPLEVSAVLELPRVELGADWYGQEVTPPVSYTLAIDPEALWFLGERAASPKCDRAHTTGDFVEGLWEQELIELFLCEETAGSTRYQEFNLSPTGAWWTAVFDEYRVRSETVDLKRLSGGVRCWSQIDDHQPHWQTVMRVPRASLGIATSFGAQSRANITAIVLPAQASSENASSAQFLSACALQAAAPDFHRSHEFSHITYTPKGA